VEVYESHWVSHFLPSCRSVIRRVHLTSSHGTTRRHSAFHLLRVICKLKAGLPGVSTMSDGHPSNHRLSPGSQKRSNRTPGSHPGCQLTSSRLSFCCRRTDMHPASFTFLSPRAPPHASTRSRFRSCMSRKGHFRRGSLTRGLYTRCAGGIRVNMASASL
jgi:hypothetical protein